jgi:putative two-component system response regulator
MTKQHGRILFVDDEPNILEMLERMLHQQREAVDATFCLSVDAALAALETKEYDVVVTDVRMPGKDGFALLRTLRESEKTRHLPVIILTGDDDRTLKHQALDMGATDLLNKPIGREELLARIRSALRLKSYQDQLAQQIATLDEAVRQRTAQLERAHQEVVWRLAKAGEYRDDQTGSHLIRVACYCWTIARALQMDAAFIELILLASPLHDIGKIAIPDSILLKPGKLTPEEWTIMRKHAMMGVEILSDVPKSAPAFFASLVGMPMDQKESGENSVLRMATTIARCHHEKWDGSGYSEGLTGQGIPIEARIVAVADAYDAMTTERPYKTVIPDHEALAVLSEDAGSHFDPDIVQAFRSTFDEVREIQSRYGETYLSSQSS